MTPSIPFSRATLLIAILLCTLIASCAQQGVNTYPLTSLYPRYEEMPQRLNALIVEHPQLIRHRIIGFSQAENLPIYAIEFGRGKRNILIIGQHHGDEMIGTAFSMYLAEHLSEIYQQQRIRELLEEYTLWIVPSLNVDAWRLVGSGEARIKRKNSRDTDKDGKLDPRTDGVDLNRNYPVFWDLDGETNILSPFYKGDSPASEKEIKAMVSFARKVDFELAIFYHSSATGALNERIFLPAVDEQDERFQRLMDKAEFYAQRVPRDYLKGTYYLHKGRTSKVGNARNFFYHSMDVDAMLIEVGGINREGRSIIHPDNKILRKIMKRHEKALLALLEYLL